MKPLHILLLLLLCVSCEAQKKSKKKQAADLQPAKPAWLSAKPDQTGYYIGIGHSNKDGTNNYIQSAKKSALEDLISEIKVNIQTTTVLQSLDVNKEFSEKYEQIIQTKAADELEEYEQVDSWEDDRNYWIYYRLSKARYHEIKEQQKRDAVSKALDFFTKARQSERGGQPVEALGLYFQGFHAIEKYLGEPIRLQFEGKEILLTNEIIASIQKNLDNIKIANTPNTLQLNRRVAQSAQSVTAAATFKDSGKPVSDLPLRATFEKGSGDVFPQYRTDGGGTAKILLTKITSRDLEQSLAVKVDMLAFAGQNPSDIYSLISQQLAVPTANVVMKVQRPLVYLTAQERSLGVDKSTKQVTNKIKNYLATAGFEFTDDKNLSELWVDVQADSEKGSASGSIYITYVTAIIKVATTKDNKEIYATTIDRVKGYSLDYERSSQEAYNKSIDALEKEKLPELLNAILQ